MSYNTRIYENTDFEWAVRASESSSSQPQGGSQEEPWTSTWTEEAQPPERMSNPANRRQRNNRIKAHSCSECPKQFQSPAALRVHFRTHTGEKPFECHKCGKRFSQKCSLDGHMWRKVCDKTSVRGITCPTCKMQFNTKGEKYQHRRKAHNSWNIRPSGQQAEGAKVNLGAT